MLDGHLRMASSVQESSVRFRTRAASLPLLGMAIWLVHPKFAGPIWVRSPGVFGAPRSEEHTSELQSLTNLVCRLLLEKKKTSDTISNSFQSSKKLRTSAVLTWSTRKRY